MIVVARNENSMISLIVKHDEKKLSLSKYKNYQLITLQSWTVEKPIKIFLSFQSPESALIFLGYENLLTILFINLSTNSCTWSNISLKKSILTLEYCYALDSLVFKSSTSAPTNNDLQICHQISHSKSNNIENLTLTFVNIKKYTSQEPSIIDTIISVSKVAPLMVLLSSSMSRKSLYSSLSS